MSPSFVIESDEGDLLGIIEARHMHFVFLWHTERFPAGNVTKKACWMSRTGSGKRSIAVVPL